MPITRPVPFLAVLAVLIFTCATAVDSALASTNTGPNSAPTVPLGVPFSGSWPGTPHNHGSALNHWWRVGALVRTGDRVQLAVDNSGSMIDADPCLLGPVDEFGADDALNTCGDIKYRIDAGHHGRVTLPYTGPTGAPFLVIASHNSSFDPDAGGYSASFEKIIRRVNIAAIAPRRIKRRFKYKATIRYGDNAAAVNGTKGVLKWRRAGRNPGPRSFKRLAGARSVGGVLKFKAKLPKNAKRKVRLKACVSQPGGKPRCTKTATVKLKTKKKRKR